MFQNDMDRKMQFSMDKVKRALEKGNGHTILSTGITGDDARMAKAVVDAGVSMLEPNHPALALARGYKGVTSMHEAEKIRHEITVSQMAEVSGAWLETMYILRWVYRAASRKSCQRP